MSTGLVVQGPLHALKWYGGIFLRCSGSLNLKRFSMVSSRQHSGGSGEPCAFAAKLEMWFSKPCHVPELVISTVCSPHV